MIEEGIYKNVMNTIICSINCTASLLGYVSFADTALKMYSLSMPLISAFMLYVINHEKIDSWFRKTFKRKN